MEHTLHAFQIHGKPVTRLGYESGAQEAFTFVLLPIQLLPVLFLLEESPFALTSPEHGLASAPLSQKGTQLEFNVFPGASPAQDGGKPTPPPLQLWGPAPPSDFPGTRWPSADESSAAILHRAQAGRRHEPSPRSISQVLRGLPTPPRSPCPHPAFPHVS